MVGQELQHTAIEYSCIVLLSTSLFFKKTAKIKCHQDCVHVSSNWFVHVFNKHIKVFLSDIEKCAIMITKSWIPLCRLEMRTHFTSFTEAAKETLIGNDYGDTPKKGHTRGTVMNALRVLKLISYWYSLCLGAQSQDLSHSTELMLCTASMSANNVWDFEKKVAE